MDPSPPGFYGRLFVVPKSSSGFRPVLDLSVLNKFLKKQHFRIETPVSFIESIQVGDWATVIDLRDAYFHLFQKHSRKWLRFT